MSIKRNPISIKLSAILFAVALLFVSCGSDGSGPGDAKEVHPASAEAEYRADEVVVNGIQCIVVKSETYRGYYVSSIDCDWSSRNGEF